MPDDRLDLARDRLVRHSLEVLARGQHHTGAFVAAPTYPTYRFGWLRDGAFCAYALDLVGERQRAAAFHGWVTDVMLRHEQLIGRAVEVAGDGADPAQLLPTRFTLDGELEAPGDEEWPNFQLDGYGTWLWTLREHHGDEPLTDATRRAVRLVTDYLVAARDLPCFDCWEEFGTGHHTSTVAAVAAGLAAAGELLEDAQARRCGDDLRDRLLTDHVRDGAFVKQVGDDRVDASSLWVALPFGLVDVEAPVMRATAERIRTELVRDGSGVVRYLGDTFYGGGPWILLTAWLAWYELATGEVERAEDRYRWILRQATEEGDLPEQVNTVLLHPDHERPWIERWGPSARVPGFRPRTSQFPLMLISPASNKRRT
jgi:isomaltose glucohydrolase